MPSYVSNVPAPVAAANRKAEAAIVALERREAAVREAIAKVRAAPQNDAADARAAYAAGKDLPPQTRLLAKQAEKDARRALEVAKVAADEALGALADVVERHRGSWLREQEVAVDAATAEVQDLIPQLRQLFARQREQLAVEQRLRHYRTDTERPGDRAMAVPGTGRQPTPAEALLNQLEQVATAHLEVRTAEPSEEEREKREGFQRTRRAYAQMARGGVHAPGKAA